MALWSAIPDLSGPTVHVTSPVFRLYLDYKNILAFSLPCSGPPPPLPSNAPQPPWQWSPSPFQILGFSDINSIFQHYWIYYSTFNLALRCIAPFSKDYSLALKVHNTLLLRLLLSLQVASNSGTRALPPYFEICSFTCYIALGVNGLPIRGYWQTVYIYRERSANNLLLADHTVCQ